MSFVIYIYICCYVCLLFLYQNDLIWNKKFLHKTNLYGYILILALLALANFVPRSNFSSVNYEHMFNSAICFLMKVCLYDVNVCNWEIICN